MDKPAPKDAQAPEIDHIPLEHERAHDRRVLLKVPRPDGGAHANWALALSGGGIRSATFCLGVMQGLARCAVPSAWKPAPSKESAQTNEPPKPVQHDNLLRQFDYLSTVSGGGYIGSFFGSLFKKGRLNSDKTLDDAQTAEQAFKVFKAEPPSRLYRDVHFKPETPGEAPLAWLRENGRYMAPTGSGDLVYAMGLQIRNWFAVHYVVGTVLFTSFLALALARVAMADWWPGWLFDYRTHEYSLLAHAMMEGAIIWWSPIWWLVLPLLTFWLVPCAIAFWQSHPQKNCDINTPPSPFSLAALCTLLAGSALLGLAKLGESCLGPEWDGVAAAVGAAGMVTALGFAWYFATAWQPLTPAKDKLTVSKQRVTLTRGFASGLVCLAIIAALATVDTVAQTLYAKTNQLGTWLTPSALVAALVWVVRRLASAFDEKEPKGLIAKLPMEAIVSIAGAALIFLVALMWSLLALWVRWNGAAPDAEMLMYDYDRQRTTLWVLGTLTALAFGLAVGSGQFPGFLNLSTLQGLYSARLTRAYLGASNGERFTKTTNPDWRSVAEPVASDGIKTEDYYANKLAPMHIVNVCLNQNIDPAEQLVQRDRKGKPLAIVPNGFTLEGDCYPMPNGGGSSELNAKLSMGEWVGVSGAAFSTGMGRRSSIGFSLLMGLSNVRLGRWWQSGQGGNLEPKLNEPIRRGAKTIRMVFKTQAYLFDELLARFHGMRRPLHYLSDGGHYENTAMYELLQPKRKVELVVICDCGCDPKYEFEDLANLIRLARIDYKSEVEVDTVPKDAAFSKYFGTPDQFLPANRKAETAEKCALLLKVYRREVAADGTSGPRKLHTRIVVLKPRLIDGISADLAQYRATRNAFPQEPTADQFYDEAQWESYRKLGLEIASKVFGGEGANEAYREALWSYLLKDEATSS